MARYLNPKVDFLFKKIFGENKEEDWYHHLQIVDVKNPDVVIDGLDYILVELPNFTRDTWSLAHKELAVLWLRFLKEIEGYRDELPEEFVSNKLIYRAVKLCEKAAFTRKELIAYDIAEGQMMWDNSIKFLEDEVVKNRKTIEEKDKALEEKDKALEDKDNTIEAMQKEIELLKTKQ